MRHSQLEVLKVLILDFAFAHPKRTIVMLSGLTLAGILEGASVVAILPIIEHVGQNGPSQPLFGDIVGRLFKLFNAEPDLASLLFLICVAMFLKAVALLWASSQVGFTVASVTADLRTRIVDSLLAARWEIFTTHSTGEVVNSLNTETQRSANAYQALVQSLASLVQAIIYLALAFAISFKVAVSAIFAGAIVLILLNYLIKLTRKVGEQQTILVKTLTARIADGLYGLKPLKAMGQEKTLGTIIQFNISNLKQVAKSAIFYKNAVTISVEPLIVLSLAVGFLLSSEVWDTPFSVQLLMALLFYRLVGKVGAIQQSWQKVMLAESAYFSLKDRLKEIQDMSERECGVHAPSHPAKTELRNICFSYGEKKLLNNVNVEILPGQITTILGSSGSGKTTLADIIVGLHTPTSGQVLLDGVDLADIDLRDWRAKIGYVPQEVFLFNQDIAANVSMNDKDIDLESINRALKRAGAWDFVNELPLGVNNNVGEQGLQLSGGQRQRIAIARALVRDPILLIFDEATSALDPDTTRTICSTIQNLKKDCAILAITHQAAWVDVSDKVYSLNRGHLRERHANILLHE